MGLFERIRTYKKKKIDHSRERNVTNVQKEDYLMRQIDEFKDKARQLQTLLSDKEQEVQALESLVSDREEKAQALESLLKTKRSEADELVAGVSAQIQQMMRELDAQMKSFRGGLDSQLEKTAGLFETQVQTITEQVGDKLQSVDGKLDAIKSDICAKVHNEDVKCYRNMKSLIEGQAEKFDQVSLSEESMKGVRSSFKGMKFFSFFAFLDFLLLLFLLLHQFGILENLF